MIAPVFAVFIVFVPLVMCADILWDMRQMRRGNERNSK